MRDPQATAGAVLATDPQALAQWLTLIRLPGLSRSAAFSLLAQFGSIEAVFAASAEQLERLVPQDLARALCEGPDLRVLQRELEWFSHKDHHLITWQDADYPALLREIADPPLALYVDSERSMLSRPQLAIVGARAPTPLGRETAREFAKALAGAGFVITSGMALGIDASAHRGALDAGGQTLALAGTGLDRVYPPSLRDLAQEIAAHGALVSEFPLGTPPRRENFPVRNRLISGLSVGVLVVEAASKSGSLITARLAAEQGREVFAIPGSIYSPLARGCHALIRQGAKLVETVEDILEEIAPLARWTQEASRTAVYTSRSALSPPLAALLEYVGYEPVSVDTLIERSGLTADVVSSMLLQLELQGHIAACAGGKYIRTS